MQEIVILWYQQADSMTGARQRRHIVIYTIGDAINIEAVWIEVGRGEGEQSIVQKLISSLESAIRGFPSRDYFYLPSRLAAIRDLLRGRKKSKQIPRKLLKRLQQQIALENL